MKMTQNENTHRMKKNVHAVLEEKFVTRTFFGAKKVWVY